jgi:hypothetical protein
MENRPIKSIVRKILVEHISKKETINEASGPLDAIGKLVSKLRTSYGDGLADTFTNLVRKDMKTNVGFNVKTKQVFLRSLNSTEEIALSQIEDAIDLIVSGDIPLDAAARQLPRQLRDGTEFRSVLVKGVNEIKSKQKPKPKVPVVNIKNDGAFKQFAQGIGLGFYDWFIDNLKRLDSIYDNFLLPGYYAKFGNLDVLQTEFNDLAEKVLVKNKRKEIINDELGKMADILSRVGHMKERQMFILWREWREGMPEKFVKDLGSWENPEFQKLVTWFETINPKSKKSSPNVTYSKMEGFKSLMKFGKNNTDTGGEKFSRFMNTVLMADPRTYKELGQNIKIYGFWRSLGKGISQKFILGFIIFPFYSSLLQTFLDYTDKYGVGLGIGDKENIKPELTGVGNTVGNSSDFSSAWKRNITSKYPIIGKDFLSLLSWSPLLWFAERERYSKLTNKQVLEKVKVTLPEVKKEKDRLQKEVVDSVNTDPSLIEGIEKEWSNLMKRINSEESETKKTDTPILPKTNTPKIIKKDTTLGF